MAYNPGEIGATLLAFARSTTGENPTDSPLAAIFSNPPSATSSRVSFQPSSTDKTEGRSEREKKRRQKDDATSTKRQRTEDADSEKAVSNVTDAASSKTKKKRKNQESTKAEEAPDSPIHDQALDETPSSAKKKKSKKSKKSASEAETEAAGEEAVDDITPNSEKKKKKKRGKGGEAEVKDEEEAEEEEDEKKRQKKTNGTEADDEKKKKKGKKDKEEKPPEDLERTARTVFVGNVPVSTKRKHVAKIFAQYGPVESVRFRSFAVANLKMPRKAAFINEAFRDDSGTLNAYVVFETNEAAQQALAFNGQLIGENHVRVDLAGQSKSHDSRRSVFIGNIPHDVKEEVVWRYFESKAGPVESVRIVRDKASNKGKGFGFVLYRSADSIKSALGLNKTTFEGRELRVFRAVAPEKASVINAKRKGTALVGTRPGAKPWEGTRALQGAALRLRQKMHTSVKVAKGKAPPKKKKKGTLKDRKMKKLRKIKE